MNNRKLSSPILSALVLAVAVSSSSIGYAQTQAPVASISAPVSQPAPAPAATGTTTTAVIKRTAPYTVVKGDSLTSIARKFNTTRKKLRDLNNIPTSVTRVKPGDILQVPAAPVSKTAAAKAKAKSYAMAQPVQDFDVPASTFASCPVPLATPGDDAAATDSAETNEKPAPIAKLVSPAEMAADKEAADQAVADQAPADQSPEVEIITPRTPRPESIPTPTVTMTLKPLPPVATAQTEPAPSGLASGNSAKSTSTFSSRPSTTFATGATSASVRPLPFNPPAARLTSRTPNPSSNSGATMSAASGDWAARFFQQARMLGNEGIEYDDDWRPPGEAHSWVMDCSNTSRYLYKVTAGIQLPRTASDQYYYLHLQGKAWDAPMNSQGFVDTEFLRRSLKPGDLLFWENTYKPERQPPITHVMVYLGTNDKGQWIMAGSQSSRGGEHNRRNGGPDIYVFRPSQPCGGYTTWLGMVHHQGRFCAFGRPLEADPTKLSVAANE